LTLTTSRLLSLAYPQELNTLEDHLRKRRLDLDLGLVQREVAERLGVDPMSVCYWETDRYAPSLKVIPRIIHFLDYLPSDISCVTLAERILTMRRVLGISQEKMAPGLGVDAATLRRWERDEGKPLEEHVEMLNSLFSWSGSPSDSDSEVGPSFRQRRGQHQESATVLAGAPAWGGGDR
jgi:transcriptional regulator with XRE-family HTH domain